MNRVVAIFRLPGERGRLPVSLVSLLQVFAMLALATVVRDYRPTASEDVAIWERMGIFVEFTSIAPIAVLFTIVAAAGLWALDPDISAATRSRECRSILKWFAISVALIGAQLFAYGVWQSLWEMSGLLAGVAGLDLALVFLVLRYLESGEFNGPVAETVKSRSD
jgi:hypothetical protein